MSIELTPDFFHRAFAAGAAACVTKLVRESDGTPTDSTICEASDAFAAFLGETADRLKGRSLSDVFCGDTYRWFMPLSESADDKRATGVVDVPLADGRKVILTFLPTGTVGLSFCQIRPAERAGLVDRHGVSERITARERLILNALCTDYTAAYIADLRTDAMESFKKQQTSHFSTGEEARSSAFGRFSEWIDYCWANLIIHESAPRYLKEFSAEELMRVLDRDGIFVSRHQTRPNAAGLQYFEVRVVKLFSDAEHYEVFVAYRPIDDIVEEEKARQTLLKEALAAPMPRSRISFSTCRTTSARP